MTEHTRSMSRMQRSYALLTGWNARLICLYLAAIILANLLVAKFGPRVTVINAFLFIGLDLTARDGLHDAWGGRGLFWKMAALIATGSALSFWINRDAGRIAVASLVSFALAGGMDALIYQRLRNYAWIKRVNGSNILSALVDSVTFPTLAFGAFLPLVVLGQFTAKVFGGFIWSLLLRR